MSSMKSFSFIVVSFITSYCYGQYTYSSSPAINNYPSSCPGVCNQWVGNIVVMRLKSVTANNFVFEIKRCDGNKFSSSGTFYVGPTQEFSCSGGNLNLANKTASVTANSYGTTVTTANTGWMFNGNQTGWQGAYKPNGNATVYNAGFIDINRTPVSTCYNPSVQNPISITGNSAFLSWSGGSGPFVVEIRLNNGTWTQIYSGNGSSTTANNLSCSNNYQWRVRASCSSAWENGSGFTTSDCCTSPTSATVNTNGAQLTCNASGGSGGSIAYKWYSGTSCSGSSIAGGTTYTATVTGSYSCKAYINGFESSCFKCASGTATVNQTPTCTPPNATISANGAQLTCNASGGSGGSIAYKWYSGTSCSGTSIGNGSQYTATASGSYSCKAYISGYESTCNKCASGTATVTSCTYSINPASNAGLLSVSSSYNIAVSTSSGCSWTASNNGNSWVTVSPTSGTGNGNVTVTLAQNAGTNTKTANITIAGQSHFVSQCAKPGIPGTPSVSGTTLSWGASTGGSPTVSYDYIVNQSSTPTATPFHSNGNSASASATIPALPCGGNTYYLHVRAKTSCNSSDVSSWKSSSPITTPQCQSSCTPPNATISANGAQLTCNASGGSGGSIAYKWYSGTSCSGTSIGNGSQYTATASGSYSCKAYISGYESTCNKCATINHCLLGTGVSQTEIYTDPNGFPFNNGFSDLLLKVDNSSMLYNFEWSYLRIPTIGTNNDWTPITNPLCYSGSFAQTICLFDFTQPSKLRIHRKAFENGEILDDDNYLPWIPTKYAFKCKIYGCGTNVELFDTVSVLNENFQISGSVLSSAILSFNNNRYVADELGNFSFQLVKKSIQIDSIEVSANCYESLQLKTSQCTTNNKIPLFKANTTTNKICYAAVTNPMGTPTKDNTLGYAYKVTGQNIVKHSVFFIDSVGNLASVPGYSNITQTTGNILAGPGRKTVAFLLQGASDSVWIYKYIDVSSISLAAYRTYPVTINTPSHLSNAMVYVDNQFVRNWALSSPPFSLLRGVHKVSFYKNGFRDTTYVVSDTAYINLNMKPVSYSFINDSVIFNNLSIQPKYWRTITTKSNSSASTTNVSLKQFDQNLSAKGIISKSRTFQFRKLSSGMSDIKAAMVLDQPEFLSSKNIYLMRIQDDTSFIKQKVDSVGYTEYDSVVQKLLIERIVFPASSKKIQYLLAEKRAPVAKGGTITFSKNDSAVVNMYDYLSDPDSLKSDMPIMFVSSKNNNFIYTVTGTSLKVKALPNYSGTDTITLRATHDWITKDTTVIVRICAAPKQPLISGGRYLNVCNSNSLTLTTASSGVTYKWLHNGIAVGTNTNSLNATAAGDYTLVIDSLGCSSAPGAIHTVKSANIVEVTNTNDAGNGSLRAAITCANANASVDSIHFNITGTGNKVILLTSTLPNLTGNGVIIDGYTQSGVEISGPTSGNFPTLDVKANNIVIRGLKFTNAAWTPIQLSNTNTCLIADNQFVSNSTGLRLGSNNVQNVTISNNSFSNNTNAGILVWAGKYSNVLIKQNNVTGNGNGIRGWAFAAQGVTTVSNFAIKENVIANNSQSGINFNDEEYINFVISQNSIYCNGGNGIQLIAGANNGVQPPVIINWDSTGISGTGTINSIVEVFAEDRVGCANAGCQGKVYLGQAVANASGKWILNTPFNATITNGQRVTATSTINSNTSQFSNCFIKQCQLAASITPAAPKVCSGQSITLTANSGGAYLWSNGASAASITVSPVTNTTYTVTVTNNGCTSTASRLVIVDPLPGQISSVSGETNTCVGSQMYSIAAPINTTTYLWTVSGGGVITGGQGTSSITINWTSTGSYTVSVSASNSCGASTKSLSVSISASTNPTITIQKTNVTTCEAQPVSFSASVSNGGSNLTYQWKRNGQNVGNNLPNYTLNTPVNGDEINCVLATTNQCSSTNIVVSNSIKLQLQVLPPDFSLTALGSVSICQGASVALAVNNNSVINGVNYQWKKGGLDISGANQSQFVASSAGVYSLVIQNNCGSKVSSNSLSISSLPQPAAKLSLSGNKSFCNLNRPINVQVNSSSSVKVLWSNGDSLPSVFLNKPGMYYAEVTDTNGCKATTDTLIINIYPSPTASIQSLPAPSACQNDTIQLVATGGKQFLWSTGDTSSSIRVLSSDEYSVTVIDVNGCMDEEKIAVVFNALPNAEIYSSKGATACLGDSLILQSSLATQYIWNNGTKSRSIVVKESGDYTVTVTNNNGCKNHSVFLATFNPSPSIPSITRNGVQFIVSSNDSLKWYLNSIPLSGITNSIYEPSEIGNYSVVATNSFGCSASSASFFFEGASQTTGIRDVKNGSQKIVAFKAYPNPFTTELNFVFELPESATGSLKLYNEAGQITREVLSNTELQSGENRHMADISDLPEGFYLGVLEVGGVNKTVRLIKSSRGARGGEQDERFTKEAARFEEMEKKLVKSNGK